MKKRLLTYLLSFAAGLCFAQDIHFSQFFMQPVYLNPANTGLFDGELRAGGMFRQQWRSVPVPYRTVSIFADAKTPLTLMSGTETAAGLIFNNDISGDSKYTINHVYIPLAIKKYIGDSSMQLSFGLSPGINSIAFRTDKLTFDQQFDGDLYNASLPSGENFPSMSRTYFDLGAGLSVQYNFLKRGSVNAGAALSHINRPRVSFFKNNDIRLYAKSAFFLSVSYPVTQLIDIKTDFMYERQGPFSETVLSARAGYLLDAGDNISLNAGISTRLKDAFIFEVGMDYKNYKFGFAYDYNISGFNVATNKRGAIEFGLIWILKKEKVFIPKSRVCPIYM